MIDAFAQALAADSGETWARLTRPERDALRVRAARILRAALSDPPPPGETTCPACGGAALHAGDTVISAHGAERARRRRLEGEVQALAALIGPHADVVGAAFSADWAALAAQAAQAESEARRADALAEAAQDLLPLARADTDEDRWLLARARATLARTAPHLL